MHSALFTRTTTAATPIAPQVDQTPNSRQRRHDPLRAAGGENEFVLSSVARRRGCPSVPTRAAAVSHRRRRAGCALADPAAWPAPGAAPPRRHSTRCECRARARVRPHAVAAAENRIVESSDAPDDARTDEQIGRRAKSAPGRILFLIESETKIVDLNGVGPLRSRGESDVSADEAELRIGFERPDAAHEPVGEGAAVTVDERNDLTPRLRQPAIARAVRSGPRFVQQDAAGGNAAATAGFGSRWLSMTINSKRSRGNVCASTAFAHAPSPPASGPQNGRMTETNVNCARKAPRRETFSSGSRNGPKRRRSAGSSPGPACLPKTSGASSRKRFLRNLGGGPR